MLRKKVDQSFMGIEGGLGVVGGITGHLWQFSLRKFGEYSKAMSKIAM